MKRILPFAVICISVLANVYGQIVITRNDMPNVGDTIRTSFTAVLPGVNYEQGGANMAWDFSDFIPAMQNVEEYVSISSVPFVYQLVFNPTVATIASPVPEFNLIPGLELTDIYQFYRETNTFYGFAGFAFTFSGLPLPLKYDNPDIYYRFPVTYNTTDSSQSNLTLSLPNLGYLQSYRKRVNNVDAWGNITTPYGSFPTIRVRSQLTTYDSIYIDSVQMGQALSRQITEYKWLTNNKGIPLMQIDVEGPLVTARYIDSVRIILDAAPLALPAVDVRLYPNPASSSANITLHLISDAQIAIEIFDLSGRSCMPPERMKLLAGSQTFTIPLQQLLPGFYVVRIHVGDLVVNRKLLVN